MDYDMVRVTRDPMAIELHRELVAMTAERDAALARAEKAEAKLRDPGYLFGVDTPCPKCGGRGRHVYTSTSTWMGGIGGSAMTESVCDACWGSGDKTRPGANLRKMLSERQTLIAERDRLRVLLDRLLLSIGRSADALDIDAILAWLRREIAAARAPEVLPCE